MFGSIKFGSIDSLEVSFDAGWAPEIVPVGKGQFNVALVMLRRKLLDIFLLEVETVSKDSPRVVLVVR